MSRKISEIMRSQASYRYNQKKKEVIHKTLKKVAERDGRSFKEILDTYISR